MRHFHHAKNPYFCSTINVDKLWTLVKGAADASIPEGEAPVVDAVQAVRCGRSARWWGLAHSRAALTDGRAISYCVTVSPHRVSSRCWARVSCPSAR